jgi:anti-sigma B factor antagonist
MQEKYGAVVIELKGDLMGGPDSEKFNELFHQLLGENKKHVVIDLSEVHHVNSTGIGILMRGFTTMKNGSGELKLAKITEKIDGLLSITKLNQIFDIYDSVDEAVQSF